MRSIKLTDIEFWGYCLLMISFFLPGNAMGFALVFLVLLTIVKFIQKKHAFKGYSGLILYPVLFLLLLVGMIYTQNTKDGWGIIERHYALIGVPILAASIKQFSSKQKEAIMNVFIATGVITALICLGVATNHYLTTGTVYTATQKDHFVYNHFMHHRLSSPLQLHAIYYSLYLSFAALILLNRILHSSAKMTTKFLYALIFVFFAVMLFLLKSSIFAFAFPLASLLLVFFRYRKTLLGSLKMKLVLSAIVVLAGIFSYIGIQSKLESFSLKYELSDDHLTPLTMRMAIWECTWETIQEAPFIGKGTGDGDDELFATYEELGFTIGANDRFNAHNMYLQYWLTNGITTALLFVLILFVLARRAINHRNMVFFSFIFLFAAFSLTESTMLRQNGIVFFLVISSLFYWSPRIWDHSQSTA
ncbi:MAG: O-antigen ligase family protein [Flavobacteriales bacterium]|nr:O-antigen ligase family protein [Flavobacteriales bacterium]